MSLTLWIAEKLGFTGPKYREMKTREELLRVCEELENSLALIRLAVLSLENSKWKAPKEIVEVRTVLERHPESVVHEQTRYRDMGETLREFLDREERVYQTPKSDPLMGLTRRMYDLCRDIVADTSKALAIITIEEDADTGL